MPLPGVPVCIGINFLDDTMHFRVSFAASGLIILLAGLPASAGVIEIYNPTNPDSGFNGAAFNSIVQPIAGYNAEEQNKFRGNTNNFNQSLDNGFGTTSIGGQPTFIQQNLGSIATNLYSFSEQHYYSSTGGPNGFVFQMQQVQGTAANGPTLVGGNPVPVSGAGIYTEAWGTGFTTAQVPTNGGQYHTVSTPTLQNGSQALAPDWAYFNSVHFELRSAIANTTSHVWNLSYTFPNTFSVINPQDFASNLTATPTTGLPGSTGYQHEWLVTDTDLRYVNFSIQGVVELGGVDSGGEREKFTTSMKNLDLLTQGQAAVPEPTTLALLLLGIPGFIALRRMKKR